MQRKMWVAGAVVAFAIGSGIFVRTASAETPPSYPGVTKPSEERSLTFSYPGVVHDVLVKEGQVVTKGQPLVRLDDRIDKTNLAQLDIEANSPLKVDYAKKSRDQKQVKYARLAGLGSREAASTGEVEEAKLNAELAVTQLALSEEESQTAKLKADAQRLKVELAELKSTIDGVVRAVNIKEGEYADPQQSQRAACVVVKTNPLKVEVYVPSDVAATLKVGDEMAVEYTDFKGQQKATVTFVDPVSDPVSRLVKLWLEMPNPDNKAAGAPVQVTAPAK